MTVLIGKYDTESKVAYEHGETTRIQAYRSRDIIRMTCVDDKLTQMKEVLNAATPRLMAFSRLADDELRMRQHFVVLQQARNRVMELAAEILVCMGDTLDGGLEQPHPRRGVDVRPGLGSDAPAHAHARHRAPRRSQPVPVTVTSLAPRNQVDRK